MTWRFGTDGYRRDGWFLKCTSQARGLWTLIDPDKGEFVITTYLGSFEAMRRANDFISRPGK